MDLKELTNLIETVATTATQSAKLTEERWSKAFDDHLQSRREELEAQIKTEQIRAEAEKAESAARNAQFKQVLEMAHPLFAGALAYLMSKAGLTPSSSTPSSTSSAPPSSSATLPSSGGWRVSTDGIDEWGQIVGLGIANILSPNTKALLRAFAARFINVEVPRIDYGQLVDALRADLGDENAKGLIRLTGMAWTREGPVATPPATNTPPNSSVN